MCVYVCYDEIRAPRSVELFTTPKKETIYTRHNIDNKFSGGKTKDQHLKIPTHMRTQKQYALRAIIFVCVCVRACDTRVRVRAGNAPRANSIKSFNKLLNWTTARVHATTANITI